VTNVQIEYFISAGFQRESARFGSVSGAQTFAASEATIYIPFTVDGAHGRLPPIASTTPTVATNSSTGASSIAQNTLIDGPKIKRFAQLANNLANLVQASAILRLASHWAGRPVALHCEGSPPGVEGYFRRTAQLTATREHLTARHHDRTDAGFCL
jgi:hypothetical protein